MCPWGSVNWASVRSGYCPDTVQMALCNETEAHSKQRQKKVLIQVLLFSQLFCTSVKVRWLNLRQKRIYLRDLWINLMQVTGRKEIAINMGQSIQEWTKSNLWKTAFRKFEGVWSVSTNFTWSTLDLVSQNWAAEKVGHWRESL